MKCRRGDTGIRGRGDTATGDTGIYVDRYTHILRGLVGSVKKSPCPRVSVCLRVSRVGSSSFILLGRLNGWQ
jgi:hypothetical protein